MKRLAAGLLLLASSSLGAQRTPPRDSLLDRLVGTWVLRGTIAGQPVVHDVSARWVLGKEYVELREVSRRRSANGGPDYEAIVYVGRDSTTGEYAALWMDNTAYGAFAPAGTGHGKAAGDSIAFLFVEPGANNFHNTFVYHRLANSWEWHLDNDDAKGRRPFARVTLTRK
jgi:hypothetical protein